MTLEELNRHLALVEEIAKVEELLRSLREAAFPGSGGLSGMPHAPGVKDKVGDLAAEIADLEAQLVLLRREAADGEAEITEWISAIGDAQTRLLFRIRFLRGMPWKEVAGIIGGRNTEDSVRMICYRYLDG